MSKALFKKTSTVSLMTLTSRVLGFVRDVLAAQIFGVNASVDAFYVAFKIPNFMRNLFAEGSFSQAFVPVLAEYRQQRSIGEVKEFVSHMAGVFGSLLLLISVLGVVLAPLLILIFGPGLDPYRYDLATTMLRITFPYIMLISLTAFTGAILNCYGRMAVPAFTPALLNIALIATAFGITHWFNVPIMAQAWGIILGGILQLGFQLPFLKRLGLLPWPRFDWHDPGVQRVLKLMLPALFGASVGQLSLLLNTIFASFLKVGSVTWLYNSERLAYFPLGVFGVALATVVLPQLSRQHAAAETAESFASTVDWGVRCNLIIGIPASLTMLILAGPLVTTLFQYGKFTPFDVLMTRESVIAYSVGLQAFMLVKVLATAFYAKQDIRTPVKVAVTTIVVNTILNATLIFPLAHAGLALASSLGSWFNTLVLFWLLHRRGIYRFQPGTGTYLLRLLFANGALAAFLWWAGGNLTTWLSWHWYERFLHIFIIGFAAIALYFFSLWISGMRWEHFKVKTVIS